MTVRRVLGAAGAGLAGAAALPATASAHGLVGRTDLPVPEWLFGWAAATVLVVSFVGLALLWPNPKLEQLRERRLLPLPAAVDVVGGAIGVGFFGLVVYAGFAGTQTATANLAPTAIYVDFWVGLVVASVLFGDVFRILSPWRAIARAIAWIGGRLSGGGLPEPLPYPERLGRWPAVAGIVAFSWLELVYTSRDDPSILALLALAYAAIQLVGMSLYGIEPWSRRADAFGVYFGLFARISAFARRNGALVVRRPLSALTSLDIVPGTVALLITMIGSITFDGFSQGPIWSSIAPHIQRWFVDLGASLGTGLELADSLGYAACVALVATVYWIGVAGMRTVDRDRPPIALARAFVHSLVPIAFAYALAHYFSLLIYQGQATAFLLSDPLGNGSDLIGASGSSIDYSVINATGIWYVQVVVLVIGHVCGLVLAHDRAIALFKDAREAVRSQYWMLAVMVAFTSLGLWLISAANA